MRILRNDVGPSARTRYSVSAAVKNAVASWVSSANDELRRIPRAAVPNRDRAQHHSDPRRSPEGEGAASLPTLTTLPTGAVGRLRDIDVSGAREARSFANRPALVPSPGGAVGP